MIYIVKPKFFNLGSDCRQSSSERPRFGLFLCHKTYEISANCGIISV